MVHRTNNSHFGWVYPLCGHFSGKIIWENYGKPMDLSVRGPYRGTLFSEKPIPMVQKTGDLAVPLSWE